MFGHDPKLVSHSSVAYRGPPRLSGLATDGLEERIARRDNSQEKQEFDRGIQDVLLQQMDKPVFHSSQWKDYRERCCDSRADKSSGCFVISLLTGIKQDSVFLSATESQP